MAIGQTFMDNAPEIGGGVTGVGGTAALREFADVSTGPLLGTEGTMLGRMTVPSVAYGIGTGVLSGIGWWVTGRGALNDFLLAHTITGIPSGAVSAALPKGGASTATAGERTRTRRPRERRAVQDGGQSRSQSQSQSESSGGLGGLDGGLKDL